jgi:uncharacterized membrane protein
MNKKKVNYVVLAGLIAALYVVLTFVSNALNVAYGPIQFRISEVMTILPVLTPAAIPGLTIGCFIANLGSPYGAVDIICGTFATFLAAVLTYYTRKFLVKKLPLLSMFFPVIVNAIIIGLEITLLIPEGFKLTAFLLAAFQIGFGQLVVCYGLGIPFYLTLKKSKLDKFN